MSESQKCPECNYPVNGWGGWVYLNGGPSITPCPSCMAENIQRRIDLAIEAYMRLDMMRGSIAYKHFDRQTELVSIAAWNAIVKACCDRCDVAEVTYNSAKRKAEKLGHSFNRT